MEFKILDDNFNIRYIADRYESAIWTIRMKEAGDFEIYTPVESEFLETVVTGINEGWYLFTSKFYDKEKDRANLMILETNEITSDPENGAKMKVTGRDLKSLLTRRIVIGQKTFTSGTPVNEVFKTLLNENIISPTDWTKTYQDSTSGNITIEVLGSDRQISNFIIEETTANYQTLTGDLQYAGEDLYSIFSSLSDEYKIGYDVLYNFTTGNFEFLIFPYRDRTYEQVELPPILFSPGFENLKNSNYLESTSIEKTFGLISGEGDEYNVMYNIVGGGTGLKRKELGISGSDVSRTKDDGTEYGNRTYLNMLLEKAKEEMKKNTHTKTYEGTAETSRGYSYPEDFDIGDIVEIINEWGISSKVLISEIILSSSKEGISVIPTFSVINEETGGET